MKAENKLYLLKSSSINGAIRQNTFQPPVRFDRKMRKGIHEEGEEIYEIYLLSSTMRKFFIDIFSDHTRNTTFNF